MESKIWYKGKSEHGYGKEGILLGDRVLSVVKNEDGFVFREECDGWYSVTYSKEEALKLIEELKDWINTNKDNKRLNK